MNRLDVFVSVGGTATDEQEAFVSAIGERLRSEGIEPHTVGRNTFSSEAPLKAVNELMDECCGTVVIALERFYFPSGFEKRGGESEKQLLDVKTPTPWTQIEAAMSYSRGLPLMVIVEQGLKSEGLLEHGYDWYVQWVETDPSALNSNEFNQVLASWKKKLLDTPKRKIINGKSPSDLTIAELTGGLKPVQLWSVLVALTGLITGAFLLGTKISGG